jgi:hypothetical protein
MMPWFVFKYQGFAVDEHGNAIFDSVTRAHHEVKFAPADGFCPWQPKSAQNSQIHLPFFRAASQLVVRRYCPSMLFEPVKIT